MELPNSFIENIAKAFYDKRIVIYEKTTIVDAEGGKIKAVGEQKGEALVNISYSNLDEQRKEYGLQVEINATVTCRPETLTLGDIIEYKDTKYDVVGLIPFDSHQKAAIKKYER